MNDEKFFAWLDGELSEPEASEMAAKVAADPMLTQLAEEHRAFWARLKSSFDVITAAPVPSRLRSALDSDSADVFDLRKARNDRTARWASVPKWAAIAATLVIGISVGTLVRQPQDSPVTIKHGKLFAAASLDRALDEQLAGAPSDRPVRISLTFRDSGGVICRTFTGQAGSGLACRDGKQWQVRGLFPEPEGQAGEYRMASGMDSNLAALVDSTISGEVFDANAEAAAKADDWR